MLGNSRVADMTAQETLKLKFLAQHRNGRPTWVCASSNDVARCTEHGLDSAGIVMARRRRLERHCAEWLSLCPSFRAGVHGGVRKNSPLRPEKQAIIAKLCLHRSSRSPSKGCPAVGDLVLRVDMEVVPIHSLEEKGIESASGSQFQLHAVLRIKNEHICRVCSHHGGSRTFHVDKRVGRLNRISNPPLDAHLYIQTSKLPSSLFSETSLVSVMYSGRHI